MQNLQSGCEPYEATGRRRAPLVSETECVCVRHVHAHRGGDFLGTALAETTESSSCIVGTVWCRTAAVHRPRGWADAPAAAV